MNNRHSHKQQRHHETLTVEISGIGPVLLERSRRAKRLNITVRPFRGVRVAVPQGVPFETAERFARSKAAWLRFHLERIRRLEETRRTTQRITIDREKAAAVLIERLEAIAHKHRFSYNRVTIRYQKTRWGSCSAQDNISLNAKIVLLPPELQDYILLHELVHTRVKHHGTAFWDELTRLEPRARSLARDLKSFSLGLIDGKAP